MADSGFNNGPAKLVASATLILLTTTPHSGVLSCASVADMKAATRADDATPRTAG
jgi:hypothetical protein